MKFYQYQIVKSTGKGSALKDGEEYRITDLAPAGEEADTFKVEKLHQIGYLDITVKAEDIQPAMPLESFAAWDSLTWDNLLAFIKSCGFDQDEYFSYSSKIDCGMMLSTFNRKKPIWDEPEIRMVRSYVVLGGSEGYYVHVDRSALITETLLFTKSQYETMWKIQRNSFWKVLNVQHVEINSEPYIAAEVQRLSDENVFIGKFWSWERAEEAAQLIQRCVYGQVR